MLYFGINNPIAKLVLDETCYLLHSVLFMEQIYMYKLLHRRTKLSVMTSWPSVIIVYDPLMFKASYKKV